MKTITIYTDGACSGNPGPGGWGCILEYAGNRKELSGYEAQTTNNRMELMAAICALEALNQPCIVELYSDSAYLINAFQQNWIRNWQRNGWKTSTKKNVENKELWLRILTQCGIHEIRWHKVKGHADNANNNRCDQLAREAISKGRGGA